MLFYDMSGNLGYEDYTERWELIDPKKGVIEYIGTELPGLKDGDRITISNSDHNDCMFDLSSGFK